MAIVNQHIFVGGMTCAACAARIEREMSKQPGVTHVQVSFFRRDAQLAYDNTVLRPKEIRAALEALGYQQLKVRESALSKQQLAGILLVIVALWLGVTSIGQGRLFVDFPLASEGAGLGALFVVGLLTSFHCLGMCGGINLSQCIPATAAQLTEKSATPQKVRVALMPALQYNFARLLSYTLVGALVGALGSIIVFDGYLRGAIQLAAGIAMVVMSLSMIGVLPGFGSLVLRLPAPIRHFAKDRQTGSTSPIVFGLLTGLMPCGPLQAMQLYALGSGSALHGAAALFAFGAGTLPLMFGFSILASTLSIKFTKRMSTAGACLVMLFGLLMFSNGWTLSGLPDTIGIAGNQIMRLAPADFLTSLDIGLGDSSDINSGGGSADNNNSNSSSSTGDRKDASSSGSSSGSSSNSNSGSGSGSGSNSGSGSSSNSTSNGQSSIAAVEGDHQIVQSKLQLGRYPSITVVAGTPVRWLILADERNINGCNNRFIASAFNLEHRFTPGENVVEFTPTSPGVYSYTCWMGMIRGTITVV